MSAREELENLTAFEPDWNSKCSVCGEIPTVTATGLCGPCTWGEADTVAGSWWTKEDEARLSALRRALSPTEGE